MDKYQMIYRPYPCDDCFVSETDKTNDIIVGEIRGKILARELTLEQAREILRDATRTRRGRQ